MFMVSSSEVSGEDWRQPGLAHEVEGPGEQGGDGPRPRHGGYALVVEIFQMVGR